MDKLAQLHLAQNPTTVPSLLMELADIPDAKIWYAVAKNPNTSPNTLATLYNNPPRFFVIDDYCEENELDDLFKHIATI